MGMIFSDPGMRLNNQNNHSDIARDELIHDKVLV